MRSLVVALVIQLLAQVSDAGTSCVDTALSLRSMIEENVTEAKLLNTKEFREGEIEKIIARTSLIVDVYAKNFNSCAPEEKSELYRRLRLLDGTSCLPKLESVVKYMNAVAANIANTNTVNESGVPYQKRMRICQNDRCEIIELATAFRLEFMPEHPAAVNGIVKLPNIDLEHEMNEMIATSQEYEAVFKACSHDEKGQIIEARIVETLQSEPNNAIQVL